MTKRKPRNEDSWKPAYEKSMVLCGYIAAGGCTPQGVERRWYQAFCNVLAHLGFPKGVRGYMWRELVYGGWDRLHLTDEEKAVPADEWLDKLRGDVFYCSDRWNLDRLMRCHWAYKAYMRKAGAL